MKLWMILLIILVIMAIALIVLYFLGKKAQKKQEEQQAQIEASKQTVSMLIIDKKKMPLNKSGLPQIVIEQTPKLMRRSKLPVVKAKVGPRIMTMICDEKIFDSVPVKKEVKAEVSGMYIVGVKGLRGPLETPEKKKGFFKRLFHK
ncbi:MAG TPA: hypothetical protein IAA45_08190 [Candidatus Blautia gallistercoris]|uniref:Type II secretion system protein G n=1 Tax=Candidatus Blautia gallistercoris TaxID=2838490 RepID=A0A9D2B3C6_9FIRM|nr:hypothetical protein [Candidatus Blautia gallistercoris]